MVERDPNDDKNVIVEIQGGAGGDEAGAVGRRPLPDAHPLRRAPRLQGRAAATSATASTRSRSRATAPTRSSSTRAARTACSACRRPSRRAASTPRPRRSRCCPRPRRSTSQIDPNDLQIDVYRSSGPGRAVGQHDRLGGAHHAQADRASSSRCRTRSRQLQNREKAMRVLRARLYERALAEQQAELAADRRAQVGTRRARREDPHLQLPASGRVTDHRIKLTVAQPRRGPRGRARRVHRRARRPTRSAGGSRRRPRRERALARRRRVREALDAAVDRAARPRASTRRGSTPSCCSRDALGVDRARARRRPRPRASSGRRSRAFQDAGAPARGRREPVAYILGRRASASSSCAVDRARADPAAGDRAAGRGRRSSCRAARACSTSAPAAARSRWRSKDERPDLRRRRRPTSARTRSRWRAPTRARLGLDVALRCAPTCSTACRRVRRRRLQPALRRGRRRAAARPRSRATSRAARCSPAPTGSTSIRRLVAQAADARRRRRSRSRSAPGQAAAVAALLRAAGFARPSAARPRRASSAWWSRRR